MAIEAIVLDLDGVIRHFDPAHPAKLEIAGIHVDGASRVGLHARLFHDADGLRADLAELR